ncbi:MAG: IS110 family transposase [Gammaproteobacteria bacterium]|nr:IS110 family transposase [Gammaproteobacteria bacterium]
MYQNFIGIDIGKENFVVAVHASKTVLTFSNDLAGFKKFYTEQKNVLSNGLVILETTGGYESAVIEYLQGKKVAVHRANTHQVKHFIRSMGRLGKSDAIDAKGLAHYGAERHATLSLFKAMPKQQRELYRMVLRRSQLTQLMVQEKNRLKSPGKDWLKNSIRPILKALKTEITRLEEAIRQLVEADEALKRYVEILKEIEGIGQITAVALLALMPELGTLNRRQAASMAGVAPHPYESGKHIGYRPVRGGRSTVKRTLFISAMSAMRSKGRLGKFYRDLIARGKKKMVALTALMRKIIIIANAKLKELRLLKTQLTT